ncbi:MAG: HPP family protein, partial [Gammaproteobacteria bacterium]|nr:HPP family protein [Gammaproteobacteria bacterium]
MWIAMFGPTTNNTGHLEKWLSAIGGLLGIIAVVFISRHFLESDAVPWVVASMGASAVLLFAVPHGPMSQPWPVLGGHVVSAAIGAACAKWVPDILLAASLSVALAIGTMHYLRCIHPPGGATALTAVVGGESFHSLGFDYVLTPTLLNVSMILLIAVVFNYSFSWRRYPAFLGRQLEARRNPPVVTANKDSGTAANHPQLQETNLTSVDPTLIRPGQYYCNGHYD